MDEGEANSFVSTLFIGLRIGRSWRNSCIGASSKWAGRSMPFSAVGDYIGILSRSANPLLRRSGNNYQVKPMCSVGYGIDGRI